MRVTQYGISEQFKDQVSSLMSKQQKLYNQVTTGQKLTNVSDDPTAMGRVLDMQADLHKQTQYGKNIERAQEVSKISYQTVDSIKELLIRAEELAAKTDDLTDPAAYTANQAEVEQLIEQAIQLGNTQFQGEYLFAGNATKTTPYVATRDANNNVTAITYAGSANTSSIEIGDGVSITPYSTAAKNGQLRDVMTHLIGLRDAMAAKDFTAVTTARTQLLSDEDIVIGHISDYAADQSRMDLADNQRERYMGSLGTQISSETDVDIAQAMVQYNQVYNSYQAALTAGSKMMKISLLDYI